MLSEAKVLKYIQAILKQSCFFQLGKSLKIIFLSYHLWLELNLKDTGSKHLLNFYWTIYKDRKDSQACFYLATD